MRKQQYILPDGSTTDRMDDAFDNAYFEVAEPIEQATGWQLEAWGPNELSFVNPNDDDEPNLTMPGSFALALAKALKREGGTTMTRPLYHDYSAIEADLPLLLEAAWVALRDAELFDLVAEETDTSDDELAAVRDRLHRFIAVGFPAGSTGSPLARALATVPGYSEAWHAFTQIKTNVPTDDIYYAPGGIMARLKRPDKVTLDEGYNASNAAWLATYLALQANDDPYLASQQAADAVYQEG